MESVLIMGGSDFIGKSLAKHFIKHQHKVDVLTTGRVDYEGVNRHFSCDRKNIEELEKALKDNEYTYEAFPAPIDVTSKNEGYDYGMYLDTSQVEAGTYDIDVITQKDNQYYSSGVVSSLELEE